MSMKRSLPSRPETRNAVAGSYSPSLYGRLASLYDAVHATRNYAGEVEFLMAILLGAGDRPQRVLELFSGTGGHTIPLAERGMQVVGVDRLAEMLEVAGDKAARRW